MELDEMYDRVTIAFAKRTNSVFESEESLKEWFLKYFSQLPFDRTNHWGGLIYLLFRDAWLEAGPEVKGEPTGHDRNVVLRKLCPLLDYSLFTQVMLNLQSCAGMAYQARDAEADIEKLRKDWPEASKLKPFEPKAKMVKEASTEEEDRYYLDLSTLRSLRIIAAFTPQISFRVSPKGSTPALADSNNLSNLGIGSDRYLKVLPGLRAFYVHWTPGTSPTMTMQLMDYSETTNPEKGMAFVAAGIPYVFRSKSGGEILNQVLFSRKVAREIFAAHDPTVETCIILPRMSSVLAVADERGENLKKAFEALKGVYNMLELSEGARNA